MVIFKSGRFTMAAACLALAALFAACPTTVEDAGNEEWIKNHNVAQTKVDYLISAIAGTNYNAISDAKDALKTAAAAYGVAPAKLDFGSHADLNALLAAADERISALQTHSANHNLAQIKVDALLSAMQGTDYNVILAARNTLHTASHHTCAERRTTVTRTRPGEPNSLGLASHLGTPQYYHTCCNVLHFNRFLH